MFAIGSEGLRDARLKAISELENDAELHLSIDKMNRLGELYHAEGRVQESLNIFYTVLKQDRENQVAKAHVQLMQEVLNFVNKDLMNP